jgi:hypothetical protein
MGTRIWTRRKKKEERQNNYLNETEANTLRLQASLCNMWKYFTSGGVCCFCFVVRVAQQLPRAEKGMFQYFTYIHPLILQNSLSLLVTKS